MDLISRQAAIDAISLFFDKAYIEDADVHKNDALYELNLVPSADLSEYCDKLWKTAYERGKAEAHPNGKWISEAKGKVAILDEFGNVSCSAHCSECGEWLTASDEYSCRGNYCPNCGCRMTEE